MICDVLYIINKKNSAWCRVLDMRDFHTVPLSSGFCGFSGLTRPTYPTHYFKQLLRGIFKRGECCGIIAIPSPRRTTIGRSIYSMEHITNSTKPFRIRSQKPIIAVSISSSSSSLRFNAHFFKLRIKSK